MKHVADKTFYDTKAANPSADIQHARSFRLTPYLEKSRHAVGEHFLGRTGIKSLELGAGTCALSLHLSHLECLDRMHCMDISSVRMRTISPELAKLIPGSLFDKLEHHEGSFNEPLPFAEASIDLLLFDAALHHASSPWDLLAECRRVLAPGGLLVAQREAFLAPLTTRYAIRRALVSDEVVSGVIENIFLRAQYEYFLRARRFEPEFMPVAETSWQRWLSFLNGMLYSKWVIVARPR